VEHKQSSHLILSLVGEKDLGNPNTRQSFGVKATTTLGKYPQHIIQEPPAQPTSRKSSSVILFFLLSTLGLLEPLLAFSLLHTPIMASVKSKREYGAAQSSVYLITSDGRTLELPIPSRSSNDPLRWSLLKRATVMGVISVFTVVGLVLVQGTSLLLFELENEYSPEVCISSYAVGTISKQMTEYQAFAT
jgi:hypothetical protein